LSDSIPLGSALILDRDDTIVIDSGYMAGEHPISFIPGVVNLLVAAADKGIPLFIATNQSGIGRGYYQVQDMHRFHERLLDYLEDQGVYIVDIVFCPHQPSEGCPCRKPNPGLLHQLRDRHGITLGNSVVVGDKESDERLGKLYCRNGFRIDKSGFSPPLISEILSEFSR